MIQDENHCSTEKNFTNIFRIIATQEVWIIFTFCIQPRRASQWLCFFPNSPNPNGVIQNLEVCFFHILRSLLCVLANDTEAKFHTLNG